MSDPDYAYLKSEAEIGDDFRMEQYSGCSNLELVPDEDLDGDFTEIGNNFRRNQYNNCRNLQKRARTSLPCGIKKVGDSFRRSQYDSFDLIIRGMNGNNSAAGVLQDLENGLSFEALLKNNVWILTIVPREFIEKSMTYEICIDVLSRSSTDVVEYFPEKFIPQIIEYLTLPKNIEKAKSFVERNRSHERKFFGVSKQMNKILDLLEKKLKGK